MQFRPVDTSSYKYVVTPREWPSDIRWVCEAFLRDEAKWSVRDQANYGYAGPYVSPRFFVAHRGKLVAVAVSLNGWKYEISPFLNDLVGA